MRGGWFAAHPAPSNPNPQARPQWIERIQAKGSCCRGHRGVEGQHGGACAQQPSREQVARWMTSSDLTWCSMAATQCSIPSSMLIWSRRSSSGRTGAGSSRSCRRARVGSRFNKAGEITSPPSLRVASGQRRTRGSPAASKGLIRTSQGHAGRLQRRHTSASALAPRVGKQGVDLGGRVTCLARRPGSGRVLAATM